MLSTKIWIAHIRYEEHDAIGLAFEKEDAEKYVEEVIRDLWDQYYEEPFDDPMEDIVGAFFEDVSGGVEVYWANVR